MQHLATRLVGSVVIATLFVGPMLLQPTSDGSDFGAWSAFGGIVGGSVVVFLIWPVFDVVRTWWERPIEPRWVIGFVIFAVANFVLPRALAALTGWSLLATTIMYISLLLVVAMGWLRRRDYRTDRT